MGKKGGGGWLEDIDHEYANEMACIKNITDMQMRWLHHVWRVGKGTQKTTCKFTGPRIKSQYIYYMYMYICIMEEGKGHRTGQGQQKAEWINEWMFLIFHMCASERIWLIQRMVASGQDVLCVNM